MDPLSPAVEAELQQLAKSDLHRFGVLPFSVRLRQFFEGTRALSDTYHSSLRRVRAKLASYPALLAAYDALVGSRGPGGRKKRPTGNDKWRLTEADFIPCGLCSLRGHAAENCDLFERARELQTGRAPGSPEHKAYL